MHTLLVLSALLVTASASAALPPFYQSRNEYQAVLNMPELHEFAGSVTTIQSIERKGESLFTVTLANSCWMDVLVHYQPSSVPGPARFKLTRGKYWCPNE